MNSIPIIRVRQQARLLPLLVVILTLVQIVSPYRGWMILLVAFGGLWLIAFMWAHSIALGLRCTRELRFGWAHVGDILEERFTLSKRGWLPAIWVELLDQSNLPDYHVSRGTGVEGNGENQWRTQRVCTRRGVYSIGPTRLTSGDPFGIYSVTLEYPAFTTLVVLPPVVSLPTIQVAPGGRAGEGRRGVNTFERSVSVKGLREYVPGDSLSNVHWPSVARRVSLSAQATVSDSLYVRLFEHTPAGDWWIFLDLNRAEQVGADENSTVESGVILAASLAHRGLQAGHAVGLVGHGKELIRLAPQFGEGQRLEILRALALAAPGAVRLDELLTRMRPSTRQATSIIVITPSTRPEWLEGLESLVERGAVLTVLLLDRVSFGGAGNVRGLFAQLGERGIKRYLITREMLRPSVSDGEHQGNWDWIVGATGRALARRKPLDERWKVLA